MVPRSPIAQRIRTNALSFAACLFAAVDGAFGDDAEAARRTHAALAIAAENGLSPADVPPSDLAASVARRFWTRTAADAASGRPLRVEAICAATGDPAALCRSTFEAYTVTDAHAAYYAGELAKDLRKLRIANAARALADAALADADIPPATWESFAKAREESVPLRLRSAGEILSDASPGGEAVIPGLVHRGDVAMLAAPSKAGKTWFLLGLSNAVARGFDFAGLSTGGKPRRVAYVDGELEAWELRERLQALAVSPESDIEFLLLRGRNMRPVDVLPLLRSAGARRGGFDLVVIDPFYSFETGRDESSAGDMVCAMQELQKVAHDTGAAVLFAHHFSKGAKGSTAKADRASGSGVLARAVNDLLTLSPHSAGEGFFLFEAVTRSFGPFAPRVVSFRWPRWEPCPDMEATTEALVGAEAKRPATAESARTIAAELAAKIKNGGLLYTRKMVHEFARERGADVAIARDVCDLLVEVPSFGVRWDSGRKVFATVADCIRVTEVF